MVWHQITCLILLYTPMMYIPIIFAKRPKTAFLSHLEEQPISNIPSKYKAQNCGILELLISKLPQLLKYLSTDTDSGYYSCGLSTATIEYSCPSVCVLVSVCPSRCLSVCVCVCVHDNSKNNGSIDLKLEHIVVYENSSDEFDIGHCPIKVKVTA